MGDSLITIIAIFIAAILMFVFPMLAVSERTDDISQLTVQTAVQEFVANVTQTGKITLTNYEKFTQTLAATGNSYDIEIERQVLDENPSKKLTWAESEKIGENVYYSEYTSQIMEELYEKGEYVLKEGDIISVKAKNTNTTMSQMLRNFFYTVTNNGTYQVAASHSGIVLITGN